MYDYNKWRISKQILRIILWKKKDFFLLPPQSHNLHKSINKLHTATKVYLPVEENKVKNIVFRYHKMCLYTLKLLEYFILQSKIHWVEKNMEI